MLKTLDVQKEFVLDPSLRLYLPLYLLDGSKFTSKDAYGHLCTVTGASWGIQGRNFRGATDLISITAPPALADMTTFTIIMWVFPRSVGEIAGRLISKADGVSAVNGWFFAILPGEAITLSVDYDGATNLNLISSAAIVYNTWQQVAATFIDATLANNSLYKNGTELGYTGGSDGVGNRVGDASTDLTIGSNKDTDRASDSIIGEVTVYSPAKTNIEIHRNFLLSKWRWQ